MILKRGPRSTWPTKGRRGQTERRTHRHLETLVAVEERALVPLGAIVLALSMELACLNPLEVRGKAVP